MSQAADRATTNYAAALLAFLDQPKPKPKLPPGRGHPEALGTVRHKGRFLKAIAEIGRGNVSQIARRLRKRPEYQHLSEHQLRRDVAKILDWVTDLATGEVADLLIRYPPDVWQRQFGITPPALPRTKSKWKLRQMALELLRYQLMAKNQ
jgi:hypothetical protein